MSSTTTRPPRTPGALVADAVANLEDAVARLAELTADGALVEVPGSALVELTQTLHGALDRGAAVATVATGVVHSSGALTVDAFTSTKAWLQGPCRKSETESKVLLASSTALRGDYAATVDAWLGRGGVRAVRVPVRGDRRQADHRARRDRGRLVPHRIAHPGGPAGRVPGARRPAQAGSSPAPARAGPRPSRRPGAGRRVARVAARGQAARHPHRRPRPRHRRTQRGTPDPGPGAAGAAPLGVGPADPVRRRPAPRHHHRARRLPRPRRWRGRVAGGAARPAHRPGPERALPRPHPAHRPREAPPRTRGADRHCAFPGCHVDVSRTHAHHVREWEQGGDTAISNTVLLCVKHHHAVHEGGWAVTRTEGIDPHATGCWTFTPPVRRARP